jgi:uncharacterized protein involved in exopolysaccharide biosynthesis
MMVAVQSAELLRVVTRRNLVAVLTAMLVLAGGVLFLLLQPRVYESSASVALLPATQNPNTLGAYDTIVTRLLPLYSSLFGRGSFMEIVS